MSTEQAQRRAGYNLDTDAPNVRGRRNNSGRASSADYQPVVLVSAEYADTEDPRAVSLLSQKITRGVVATPLVYDTQHVAPQSLARMDPLVDENSLLTSGANMQVLLIIFAVIVTITQAALAIYLLAKGHYKMDFYTYWGFTFYVFYFPLVVIALLVEGAFLTFVVLFLYPIAIVNTLVVAVSIVVIINYNPAIYSAQSVSGGIDMGDIHTGDWLLHVFPLVSVLAMGQLNFNRYTRKVIRAALASWTNLGNSGRGCCAAPGVWYRVLYYAYFLLITLVPLGVYSATLGIDAHYPTGIPTPILWLALVAIVLVWGTLNLAQAVVSGDVMVKISGFGIATGGEKESAVNVPAATSAERFEGSESDEGVPEVFGTGAGIEYAAVILKDSE